MPPPSSHLCEFIGFVIWHFIVCQSPLLTTGFSLEMNPPGKSFKEARYKNTSQIKVFSLYKYAPKEHEHNTKDIPIGQNMGKKPKMEQY